MNKVLTLIIIFIFFSQQINAQDIRFSQFTNTPLLINPGLTGMGNGYSRASIIYRSQWASTNNSYNTTALSVDFPIYSESLKWKKGYLATGFTFYNDNTGAGSVVTNEANLAFSSVVFVGKKSKISLGTLGGYAQKSIDPNKIQWDSQYNGIRYDPFLPSQEDFTFASSSVIDLSTGMSYRYSTNEVGLASNGAGNNVLFEGGIAAFHLLKPKFNFYQNSQAQTSRRFVGHGRFLSSVDKTSLVLGGNFLYMKQGASQEITIGFEVRSILKGNTKYTGFVKDSYIGAQLLYRNKDALIPVIFYKFNNWRISTSYDYNFSALNNLTGGNGGFEISIQFNDFEGELFNQGRKHNNYRGSGGNF